MATPTPLRVPTPALPPQQVKPPTCLLMGPPSTGKSDSLTTWLDTGLDVFLLITEPNGLDTVLEACHRRKVSTEKLHWHYVTPAPVGLDALELMAKRVADMSYEDLSRIKTGIGKESTRQFIDLLHVLANFIDEKDGQSYGSVFNFEDDKVLCVDSLSGINQMAMDLTIGFKPTASEGEWGVAMNVELKLIQKLCGDLRCFFVLTAHVEKEPNEISGANAITSAALGKKNAGKIARSFSEIILTKRLKDGKTFKWSTWETTSIVDLKNRALPISDAIEPNFKLVYDAHVRRKAQAIGG